MRLRLINTIVAGIRYKSETSKPVMKNS